MIYVLFLAHIQWLNIILYPVIIVNKTLKKEPSFSIFLRNFHVFSISSLKKYQSLKCNFQKFCP